jgi:sialic acid synthase SpsE/sugar phosphate isomerase/epimerase
MYYIKNIESYKINVDSNISEILAKIEKNDIKFLCVTNFEGQLLGVLSLGDIVKIFDNYENSKEATANDIMNSDYAYAKYNDNQSTLVHLLEKYRFVPVLDHSNKLQLIIAGDTVKREFSLGKDVIRSQEDYISIAEIGNNHNGSIERAFKLIKLAKESGANIVKFQMRDLENLYGSEYDSHDLSTEYIINLLNKVSLCDEDMYKCFDYCKEIGVTPLCTPFDLVSLSKLERYGLDGYKVSSADLTNHELLSELVKTKKPLIVSTGMSNDEDIDAAIKLLDDNFVNYVLCHTNSTYPTPFSDINLNYINNLRSKTRSVIGYSGHERGFHIPLAAFAMGAQVIEKHFTLDKSLEGNDHKVSLLPDEFNELSRSLADLSQAVGVGYTRQITQGEATNKVALSKSLFCCKPVKNGDLITESHVVVRSPGNGLSPRHVDVLIGKIAHRDILPGQAFFGSDLDGLQLHKEITAPLNFKWSIPVRHRDVYRLSDIFSPPSVEFHLSFKDLSIEDESVLTRPLGCEIIVHAPEQFDGDFVIDLFSVNQDVTDKSIGLLNIIFKKAKIIAKLMQFNGKPKVIVNCGGHTRHDFLSDSEIKSRISIFVENVKRIDFSGCRFLAQTMPPYPWHFGGQSFHNQFTSSENILSILEQVDLELCLDISHSYMWCNFSSKDFATFIQSILKYVSHIHISDAAGESEEGLQIGEGNVDFSAMLPLLIDMSNDLTLLPEIWQGHDNDGDGFRVALKRLAELGY